MPEAGRTIHCAWGPNGTALGEAAGNPGAGAGFVTFMPPLPHRPSPAPAPVQEPHPASPEADQTEARRQEAENKEAEDQYDATLEDSFPASDPPPGPSKIGPRRDRAAAD